MTTAARALVREGDHQRMGDLRILGPWFISVLLNSYAVTLYMAGCFDFAGERFGAKATVQLWMSAAWGFAYIFVSLTAGKLTARFGGRRTTLIMAALSVLTALAGLALLVIARSSPWAPVVQILLMLPMNMTANACWPALESAISKSAGRMRLSTRMSVYNLTWAVAGFAAFFSRGALEQLWLGSVFVVPAVVMGLSALNLLFLGISQPEKGHEVEDAETVDDTDAVRRRARTLLHMAWVGNALAYVAINVITPVLMKVAEEAGVSSLVFAGVITSVWGLLRFTGFVGIARWTGWHYKARWLVGAMLTLALSFLVLMTVHQLWALVLSQILFGLAAALIYSSSLYYAMHTSEGSGDHAGFHEALIGVGIFIGPAIGALAGGDSVGTNALFRIGSSVVAVLLLGAAVMAWMARKPSDPNPLAPSPTREDIA